MRLRGRAVLAFVLPLAVSACVPASSRRSASIRVVSPWDAPLELAVTPEDRAAETVAELRSDCARESSECDQRERQSIYPPVEDIPRTTEEVYDPRSMMVRSLGAIVRWEPGARRVELDRGNSATWNGDTDSDPFN